jgi:hypothetical protein
MILHGGAQSCLRPHSASPGCPGALTVAERILRKGIGSIRRDCLDHIVVFSEQHLRHLLRCYASYYNQSRAALSA